MLSATWAASSRVGVSTKARGCGPLGRPASISRCSSGRVKAAVLPVPVWAEPITSRPVNTSGIAWAWIGLGSV